MANTLKLGAGKWATGTDTVLAFNDENNNFKPLPFDFSRASSATVVNQSGLIETVGSGEPRIDFLGNTKGALLLEPQRINLITYSEAFDNAYWTKVSSSVTSGFLSPKGDLSAFKLVENTENAAHITFASPTITLGNNTFSVFAKAAERRVLGIEFPSNGILVSFDLIDGVFVNSQANPDNFSITPFSNGWYRIDITENLIATSVVSLSLRDNDGNRVYQGDGTSGLYIYGAQLEVGSYATSYIPTSGQSGGVTRVADSCNQTLPSSVFNSYPFSVFAEVDVVDTNTGSAFSLLNKPISTQYFTIEYFSNVWHITARPNGSVGRITSTSTVTKGTHKLVGVWESTSMKLYLNGSLIASGSNSQSFNSNVDSLLLGQLRISGDTGTRNTVIQTDLYNTALTDAEAIALTTI